MNYEQKYVLQKQNTNLQFFRHRSKLSGELTVHSYNYQCYPNFHDNVHTEIWHTEHWGWLTLHLILHCASVHYESCPVNCVHWFDTKCQFMWHVRARDIEYSINYDIVPVK